MSGVIVKNPSVCEADLIDKVATLADRLKFYDPVGDVDEDGSFDNNLDISRPDNSWLKDLRRVQNDYNVSFFFFLVGLVNLGW